MRRGLIVLAAFSPLAASIALIAIQPPFAIGRLLICLSAVVFVSVSAWAAPARLRNALVVVSSLVFGLAVIEGASLIVGTRPRTPAADASISHARPIVGWGPTRPGVYDLVKKADDGRVIYSAKVTIDDHLNRKTIPSSGPGSIAFFGDSFVFGDGVNDDGTLPQVFSDLNGRKIPILNLAYSGWSPAQNLAALQTDLYQPVIEKPRHFILFTSSFHVERTGCRGAFAVSTAPRYVLDSTTLRSAGLCAGWVTRTLAPLLKFAQGFAVFQRASAFSAAPTKRDVETYIKIIETFVTTARQKYGVQTTVLFWPMGDTLLAGTGYTETDILDAWRRAQIDILIDKLPGADDDGVYRITGDGHPTPLANRLTANEVMAHLRAVDPTALALGQAE